MNVYGEQGYSDAAAAESARLDAQAEAQAEAWAAQVEHDMSMMAADRESDCSELDAEYAEASV